MSTKVVAFDVDGVLADFEEKLVDVLVKDFGRVGSMNRHLFSLEERFSNYPEVLAKALRYVNDPNFYYGIEPDPYACKFVEELMENGFTPLYVTSRPKVTETFTRRWLEKNTPDYKKSYGLFCGVEDKAAFLSGAPVYLLIDDSPEQFTRCKSKEFPVVIWMRQWNDHIFPRLIGTGNGVYWQQNEFDEPVSAIEVINLAIEEKQTPLRGVLYE